MKKTLLWIFIPFILIQSIRMDVPATLTLETKNEIETPKKIMEILKRSCYDCHSNSLVYPWYSQIAPLSWYTQDHVKDGRRVVNFSIWKSYDRAKQFEVMDKLPKSLLIRMPLPDYLWLHEDAKLSESDKKILTKWAEKLAEDLK
ncbi:heme-binding domain-containing protein [Sulfurovum sp. bin170]|uniref:heme-binding domain-containing protein n=1 Tax=Sulfurovum sp. bin170 TaxID=2695268 RepID=UPI0013DF8181|nr:heme-binding domain-containing protein [Sulfurovum sp. bin170]NEW61726.1 heme-binding domain-containing protein [Sulfurovum sp. bin170]